MAMQQDRKQRLRVQPHIDVEPAMSTGEKGLPNRQYPADVPRLLPRTTENAATRPSSAIPTQKWSAGSGRRSPRTEVTKRAGRLRPLHPEFRTDIPVAGMTVTGVLPATPQLPVGSIAISDGTHWLSCDQALQLADALLLAVMRIDVVTEKRHGTTTNTTHERKDRAMRSQPVTQHPPATEGA